jgi:formylglycine-generating enzyme required for sulfatase activity
MKKYLLILFVCLSGNVISQSAVINKDSLKTAEKVRKLFVKNNDFVYVPTGSYTIDDGDHFDAPTYVKSKTVSVQGFYMMEGEVRNMEYLKFLSWLKDRDTNEWRKMLPDTNVWRVPLSFNDPYVEYYLRHPAYMDYPVVGVSYDKAVAYCKWATEAYNANPEREFDRVLFRLPTQEEWEYAARGDIQYSPYPWGGPHIRNSEGEYQANCLHFESSQVWRDTIYRKSVYGTMEAIPIYRASPTGDYGGKAGELNDQADITAPVFSYWPNGYGLYNMAGNVAEMVAEPGITCGGSWQDPGYYLQNSVRQFYTETTSSTAARGFRVIMVVENTVVNE